MTTTYRVPWTVIIPCIAIALWNNMYHHPATSTTRSNQVSQFSKIGNNDVFEEPAASFPITYTTVLHNGTVPLEVIVGPAFITPMEAHVNLVEHTLIDSISGKIVLRKICESRGMCGLALDIAGEFELPCQHDYVSIKMGMTGIDIVDGVIVNKVGDDETLHSSIFSFENGESKMTQNAHISFGHEGVVIRPRQWTMCDHLSHSDLAPCNSEPTLITFNARGLLNIETTSSKSWIASIF